jgi:hypothetical protein
MTPKLNETIFLDFVTSDPETGEAVDADALPTCKVREDATESPIHLPTVVKRSGAGEYFVPIACTDLNGYEPDRTYNVIVEATVAGRAAKAKLATFQVRALATADTSGRVTLAPTGLDAISTTLLGKPTTFPQWILWFILRFRRTRLVKATGVFSVYGTDQSTVITNQLTTANDTQQTVGAIE